MPDFGFDEWMDAQLRNVSVPRDLHARLSAGRPPSDDELDALLRGVPVPPHLERHLRRIPRHTRPALSWDRLALAASVLLVVSAGAYLALFRGPNPSQQPTVARGPKPKMTAQSPRIAAQPVNTPRQSHPRGRRQEPILVPLGTSRLADGKPEKLPFTLGDVGSSVKQVIETTLRNQAALGASGQIKDLPTLDAFEAPLAYGVIPPRLQGYDMLFHLRYGEHPFVSPAAHKDLRVSRVPFTFRTTSFDLAATSIEAGQLPPNDEIRVEDFLAAQRYALPPPPAARLALHAAVSPSALGEPGVHLLQLVVQGGAAPNPPRQPARLIAVVDTSRAMQFDARAKTVERAFASLQRHLAPGDRLTLIGFAEQPRVLAADATRDEVTRLLASGALGQTTGSADFTSAVQSACDVIRAVETSESCRVVFVTAGRAEFDDAQFNRSRESLLQLAAANIPWQIVRLSSADDSQWSDLARVAHGRTSSVASPGELGAVLLECLAGRSQTVAHDVSLKITFNPQVVTSYRMLGHASATLTGEAGDPLEIDLLAEQTATAMYEMWLKPTDKGDVALVELLWRDPASGQPRRSVQPIRRSQIAASFPEAAPWLQQGIVAARTAEYLRASYFVPHSRRLDQVLELAGKVDPQAAAIPEFQALVRLIDHAARLHK